MNGNLEEKFVLTYEIVSKLFIYLYIKLNDPNYVLIKATIDNLK